MGNTVEKLEKQECRKKHMKHQMFISTTHEGRGEKQHPPKEGGGEKVAPPKTEEKGSNTLQRERRRPLHPMEAAFRFLWAGVAYSLSFSPCVWCCFPAFLLLSSLGVVLNSSLLLWSGAAFSPWVVVLSFSFWVVVHCPCR